MPFASKPAAPTARAPNSTAVMMPPGPTANPVATPTTVNVPKANVHAPPIAVMTTPAAVKPPDERKRFLRLRKRRPLLSLLGRGGRRLLKPPGNTGRCPLRRPVARLPVTLLPVGLLRRTTSGLLFGLARLLLALAFLLQLLVGLQVLLGRLPQRLGRLAYPRINNASELREGLVHRPAHLLEVLGRHAGDGTARGARRPRTSPRRARRGAAALGMPIRIPADAALPGTLLPLKIFGHLIDIIGPGLLRPGLLRPGLLRLPRAGLLRRRLPGRAPRSAPTIARPLAAHTRTLRIHANP